MAKKANKKKVGRPLGTDEDRRIPLSVSLRTGDIEAEGGSDAVRRLFRDLIEKRRKKRFLTIKL